MNELLENITQYENMITGCVEKYMWAVRQSKCLDREDLFQVGYVALIEAAGRYSEGMAVSFEGYAKGAVRNALYRECSEKVDAVKIPASTRASHERKAKAKGKPGKQYSYTYKCMDANSTDKLELGRIPEESQHLDYVEAKMAERGVVAVPAEEEALERIAVPERKKAAQGIHDVLTDRQIGMLEYYYKCSSYVEVGTEYGITRQTARTVCQRAENRVRQNKKLREKCQVTGLIR